MAAVVVAPAAGGGQASVARYDITYQLNEIEVRALNLNLNCLPMPPPPLPPSPPATHGTRPAGERAVQQRHGQQYQQHVVPVPCCPYQQLSSAACWLQNSRSVASAMLTALAATCCNASQY